MRNLKKLSALLILFVLVLYIPGCTNNASRNSENEVPAVEINTNPYIVSDKVVDEFQFTNASLVYENGTSTFSVQITNTSDVSVNIDEIPIIFYDPDGKQVAKLVGHVGGLLKSQETRQIVANHFKNMSDAYRVEYIIAK